MFNVGQTRTASRYPKALAAAKALVARLEATHQGVQELCRREDMNADHVRPALDEFSFIVGVGLLLDAAVSTRRPEYYQQAVEAATKRDE